MEAFLVNISTKSMSKQKKHSKNLPSKTVFLLKKHFSSSF